MLEDLSEFDRQLLDSTLSEYHKTKSDSSQMQALEHIVDNCWDPEVWPKYNEYLIEYIKTKLVFNKSKREQDYYIHFLAGAISNKGFLYDSQGELMLALDYYHQSLKLYERIEDQVGIGVAFNNLGVLYSVIGDTTKALEYHKKSLQAKKIVNDLEGLAMSYNNIGTIYENKRDVFLALEYYERSLKIRKEIGDLRGIAISYENIGDIYFLEEVYGKALYYYEATLEIWDELNVIIGKASAYNSMANVYLRIGNLDKALDYGLRSYEIAEELDYPKEIEFSSRTLLEIYKKTGDYEKAVIYAESLLNARARFINSQNTRAATKRSMQYEYQKKMLQDSLEHVRQTEIRDVQLAKQRTQSYGLYAGLGLLTILFIVSIRSYQRKKKDNLAINEQKEKVENQKAEIEKQHVILANTHKEISDSISYAKRIQEAILPSKERIHQLLGDVFVYYKPKDVVSGDFYWIVEQGDHIIVAAADCTGHGVPGAMVSVVCSNALNRVVREFKVVDPAEILNRTKNIIIESFDNKQEDVKDGMDISLLSINKKNKEIHWAGAFNPLYFVRTKDDTFHEITADKQPVGKFNFEREFTSHLVNTEPGDTLYLFTDGFVDQFGGPNGKKYKYGPFKKLLSRIAHESTQKQIQILDEEFNNWKGDLDQIDDVCIIGIKV